MPLAVIAIMLLSVLHAADAQSVSSLRSQMRGVESRRAALEATLRELKSDQAQAHRKLAATTTELSASRSRLRQAKARLAEVRETLRTIKAEQKRTLAELAAHKGAMSERVLAMWRSGESSYFEVVLEATSFEDFANRAEFAARVANQDEEMLDGLAVLRDRLADQRATIEVKEREAAELRTTIAQQTALVEERTREARALSVEADAERAKAEREHAAETKALNELAAMVSRVQAGGAGAGAYDGRHDGRFIRPVKGRLTSPFGPRRHPIYGYWGLHNGIDLAARSGTPIVAAADGRVVFVGERRALGNTVTIDHGSGWSTLYGHCSSFCCSRGQVVKRGQLIARVGSTGWSTGPHVHWTVMRNRKAVNPLHYCR